MQWLGNYKEDDIVHFLWPTNAADGASITRAIDGEVRVYKDNGVAQTVVGITDTEDFDGLVGVHACTIDLDSDAFYAIGADYSVVLQGATIDSKVVNAVLAHFSIENRVAAPTVNEIADQVWDEKLTGATHNVSASAGRRLRQIAAYAIHNGTARGGTATTITLAAGADGGDGIFNRNLIVIVGGMGAGQTRTIADYNDTTKVCIVDREWRISPNDTSEYQILADDTPLVVEHGVARNGTLTTITLRDYASSTNDTYLCNIITIVGGTGRGQARLVGSYNGSTKVVTICGDNWVAIPDDTSVYVMVPYGTSCASCVGATALTQINTEIDAALTDYDPPTRTEATADKDEILTEVDANGTKIDTIDGIVDEILRDTGIDGVVVASDSKTGYILSNEGIDAILAEVIEGTITIRQALRLFLSVLAGKSAGGGTNTLIHRDIADSKDRISATVDADGNRTAMELDGT